MTVSVEAQSFPLAEVFTISRGSRTEAKVLTVTVEQDGATGRGECVPYARYDETLENVTAQINEAASALGADFDRALLREVLPAGAARNALDCAIWDLEAKRSGARVWTLAGQPEPGPVTTAYTLSLADPAHMEAKAAEHAHRPLLKIKLGGEGDMGRLEAVRRGAPDSRIIVDANEGWTAQEYAELAPTLIRLNVAMVEQPLPAGSDDPLGDIARPVPVCADESCHDSATLSGLHGKYDMINIKLDKTGGLTEALALRAAAESSGFGIMVGCMVGSSLAMAPAMLPAQGAAVVDLDAPLLLAADRDPPLRYDGSTVYPSDPALWG